MEKIKSFIQWFFVILWMLIIFYLSNQSGVVSTNTSSIFVNPIQKILPGISFSILTTLVRKSAHFFLYCILGMLVINACNQYKQKLQISLLICLLYACSDEIHQLFVVGRSGQIRDVFVDFLGISMGVFLFFLIKRCKKITH